MKWQAVTVVGSSSSLLAREDAAALFTTLEGIESTMRLGATAEAVQAVSKHIDAIAGLRDHPPQLSS